ncbi:MAG: hypothetical protein K2X47_03710 [Bdellovibrionales bacterium]|nr:hypothetical protein [Bdellovibrionales bacterium]
MTKSRQNQLPKLERTFWTQRDKAWFADLTELKKAIEMCGHSEDMLRRRMGAGFSHLNSALLGKGLSIWEASHVEWGIQPASDLRPSKEF